jgi:hypothetical protein
MYSHPPDVYRRTRAVRGCVYAEKGGASSKDTSSKDTSRLGLFVAVCMLRREVPVVKTLVVKTLVD